MKKMSYQQAAALKHRGLGRLMADRIIAGHGVGNSIKSSISDKTIEKFTRLKSKFDPMNIGKLMGGRLGAYAVGKLTGRSQHDMAYFTGGKGSRTFHDAVTINDRSDSLIPEDELPESNEKHDIIHSNEHKEQKNKNVNQSSKNDSPKITKIKTIFHSDRDEDNYHDNTTESSKSGVMEQGTSGLGMVGVVQKTKELVTKISDGQDVKVKKGDGAADVLAKIYNLVKKSITNDKKLHQIEHNLNISKEKQRDKWNAELIKAISGIGGSTVTSKSNDKPGDFFSKLIDMVKNFFTGFIENIFGEGVIGMVKKFFTGELFTGLMKYATPLLEMLAGPAVWLVGLLGAAAVGYAIGSIIESYLPKGVKETIGKVTAIGASLFSQEAADNVAKEDAKSTENSLPPEAKKSNEIFVQLLQRKGYIPKYERDPDDGKMYNVFRNSKKQTPPKDLFYKVTDLSKKVAKGGLKYTEAMSEIDKVDDQGKLLPPSSATPVTASTTSTSAAATPVTASTTPTNITSSTPVTNSVSSIPNGISDGGATTSTTVSQNSVPSSATPISTQSNPIGTRLQSASEQNNEANLEASKPNVSIIDASKTTISGSKSNSQEPIRMENSAPVRTEDETLQNIQKGSLRHV